MVKKTKKEIYVIKELLLKGWSQKKIAKFLNLSKQRVNYWAHHQIKSSQRRKTKLRDIYKDTIIRWAKNKPTSSMSCRKIAAKINRVLKLKKEFDNKGKILSVSYKTVNNILKEFYGRPKKIRKVFFCQTRILSKD